MFYWIVECADRIASEVGASAFHSNRWHIATRFGINNPHKIRVIPGKCRMDNSEKNENYAQNREKKTEIKSNKSVKKCDTNKQTNKQNVQY